MYRDGFFPIYRTEIVRNGRTIIKSDGLDLFDCKGKLSLSGPYHYSALDTYRSLKYTET